MKEQILVTGAYGQIGTDFTLMLREIYPSSQVVATDINAPPEILAETGPSDYLNVTDPGSLAEIIHKYKINKIYHLASILSGRGEKNPQQCWKVNMDGLFNVLEAGRLQKLQQVVIPSSIAVFGPDSPKDNTPLNTIVRPNTIYGVSKAAGELLSEYYYHKYGLDTRNLRFPGIISHKTKPGGGSTDYAVEMYLRAVQNKSYSCFVAPGTTLPFMYIPDALTAMISLAQAPEAKLIHRSFNVAAFSASAREIEEAIRRKIPSFSCRYEPDFRQNIVDSWPRSIDDAAAREEWGWSPNYDLESITKDMIHQLSLEKDEKNQPGTACP